MGFTDRKNHKGVYLERAFRSFALKRARVNVFPRDFNIQAEYEKATVRKLNTRIRNIATDPKYLRDKR